MKYVLSTFLFLSLTSLAIASGSLVNHSDITNLISPYYQDKPLNNFVYGCSPGYVPTVGGTCTAVVNDSSEDVELDKAMTICRSHRTNDNITYFNNNNTYNEVYGRPYVYEEKWKNCTKVENRWYKSVAGLAEKKRMEQEQKDLDFINKQAEK